MLLESLSEEKVTAWEAELFLNIAFLVVESCIMISSLVVYNGDADDTCGFCGEGARFDPTWALYSRAERETRKCTRMHAVGGPLNRDYIKRIWRLDSLSMILLLSGDIFAVKFPNHIRRTVWGGAVDSSQQDYIYFREAETTEFMCLTRRFE